MQTFFSAYLLYYFRQKRVTVVYEAPSLDACYRLSPAGQAVSMPLPTAPAAGLPTRHPFAIELSHPDTVYIFDCGSGFPGPKLYNALTFVTSSPDPTQYKSFEKAENWKYIMPIWSAEECAVVVPAIYPARRMADGNDEYVERFQLFGGIARTVFSSRPWDMLVRELEASISGCDLPAVLRSITRDDKMTTATYRLLHYVVDESNFYERYLTFASEEVERLLFERQEDGVMNEVVSFLLHSTGKPDLASIRGKAFEYYAHRHLIKGGSFRRRWLADDSDTPGVRWTVFPPTKQRLIRDNLGALQAEVSAKGSHTDHLRFHSHGSHSPSAMLVHSQEYARLRRSNYPTIDAALRPLHLFQMTVSETHSINARGLDNALTQLNWKGAEKCFLWFVVPDDVFPVFREPYMEPAGVAVPENVHLGVLEIPLPKKNHVDPTLDTAAQATTTAERKVRQTAKCTTASSCCSHSSLTSSLSALFCAALVWR